MLGWDSLACLFESPVDARAFLLYDLVELLLNLVDDATEVVAVQFLLAASTKLVHQVLDTFQALPVLALVPPLKHPVKRVSQIAVRDQVI